MTKQEIEKMFSTCNNYYSCASCPYNPEDISLFIGDKWVGGCPNCDRKLVYAMSKGYQKIPEDSILLSKEEQEKILTATESRINKLKEQVKQARKETAEKIFDHIREYAIKDNCIIWRVYFSDLEEIVKQFGVEVKE